MSAKTGPEPVSGRWGYASAGSRYRTHVGSGQIDVRITVSPSPAALAKVFSSFADEIMDFRAGGVWEKLIPIIIDEERKIFAARGVPLKKVFGGGFEAPWAPLAAGYARWRSFRKGRRKKSKRALRMVGPVNRMARNVLTGKLFAKLTSPSSARMGKRYLRFGVYSLPYARAVMFGHPKRPFLGATDRIKGAAGVLMNQHIDNMIDRISARLGMSSAMVRSMV